jgi:putative hemolysin
MWTVELIVMGVMIALNSVFAAYEIALASVGAARLDTLVHERRGGAASALRMRTSMEASLAVVQLGITLVGAIAAATGGAGAEASIEPLLRPHLTGFGLPEGFVQFTAIAIVVLPLTYVTIIFGELVPKVFALRNKEWIVLKLSPIMEWFSLCVFPAVWLLETSVWLILKLAGGGQTDETISEEAAQQELQATAAHARSARLIGRREERIIVNAARLRATPVRRIMLPDDYITLLHVGDSLGKALLAAHHDMHTRFPVAEKPDDPQTIVGYVNFKDVVAAMRLSPKEPSLRSIMRPLPSVGADISVAACLEQLIRDHNHIALVRDEQGKVLGMITMEDILEELVGEIHDEYDRLPAYIVPSGEGWIVGGNASLSAVAQQTGLELSPPGERPVHTFNEWVMEHLGRPVDRGEEFYVQDYRILVRKVRRQFVMEAQITHEDAPRENLPQTSQAQEDAGEKIAAAEETATRAAEAESARK